MIDRRGPHQLRQRFVLSTVDVLDAPTSCADDSLELVNGPLTSGLSGTALGPERAGPPSSADGLSSVDIERVRSASMSSLWSAARPDRQFGSRRGSCVSPVRDRASRICDDAPVGSAQQPDDDDLALMHAVASERYPSQAQSPYGFVLVLADLLRWIARLVYRAVSWGWRKVFRRNP